jgi:hypothetical protein
MNIECDKLHLQEAYDSHTEYSDKVKACIDILTGTEWWIVERNTYKVEKIGPMYQHSNDHSNVTDGKHTRWWPDFKLIGKWQKYDIIFETEKEAVSCALYNHKIKEQDFLKLASERTKAIEELTAKLQEIINEH